MEQERRSPETAALNSRTLPHTSILDRLCRQLQREVTLLCRRGFRRAVNPLTLSSSSERFGWVPVGAPGERRKHAQIAATDCSRQQEGRGVDAGEWKLWRPQSWWAALR
uniref:Uncharacterized protein n=1 Tax=Arundo donax TaxID=35708 RepID=A0A0A8YBP3_ARUDO